jgi:UDP-GlcNAc:undecaprenyl-phosphate GlcNAc-1-phosphate transferase
MAVFLKFIFIALGSLAVSALLTKAVRDLARRFGLAAGPKFSHHTHRAAVPRLGGVAIFVTCASGYGIFFFLSERGLVPQIASFDIFKLLIPATFMFVAGLVDDLRNLSPGLKLVLEIAGGTYLYFSGLRFGCLHLRDAWSNSALCLVATVFWVVLICNAINLIDGLDGLAAGSALFSMVTIFTLALVQGRTGVAITTAFLAGSVLGFLVFNINPATIFLGDSGSLFIGFMLSGLVLAESPRQESSLDAVLIPLISLALPLTDTVLSVLRRFLNGHRLFGADREHIHHKLLDLGLTSRQAVGILYGFSALCAVLSMMVLESSQLLIPVGAIFLLAIFWGVRKLAYKEFAELRHLITRVLHQRKQLARNIALRKAIAQLSRNRTASEVFDLLETCLKHDFDGFEVILDARFDNLEPLSGLSGLSQRFWAESLTEKLILDVALVGAEYGLIGHLLLHHSVARELLIDTSLLKRELPRALSSALEGCLGAYSRELVRVSAIDPGVQWVQ